MGANKFKNIYFNFKWRKRQLLPSRRWASNQFWWTIFGICQHPASPWFSSMGGNCTKSPVPNNAPTVLENIFTLCLFSSSAENFSLSGLLVRPNRARMDDRLLSQLVFLRGNNALWLDVFIADNCTVQLSSESMSVECMLHTDSYCMFNFGMLILMLIN